MQNEDNIQPKRLAAKVSHLKTCIDHLHDLTNLLFVESPDHDGIKEVAHKAYLEAHQFDPRDIIVEKNAYTGMRPLSDSASDLEIRLQDRSVVLTEVLRSVVEKPKVLESYRTHRTQLVSMITTLESLYKDLIPKADDEPSHSPDFTSANWYGTRYTFAKGDQAETIRVLWEAWEAGGHSLSQESIGEKICSKADRFELRKVFRTRQEDGGYSPHPAWGTMIRQSTKGSYCFEKPKKRP